jgi:hypothetical protein
VDRDGLGGFWAPDGTQAVGGEDALRALPADAAPPDAAARRPGDVVIPAVPLGDDPGLAADAITRWMDDDRARREPTPPTSPTPSGEGAPRATAAPQHPPVPQFTVVPQFAAVPPAPQPAPPPRPTPAPPSEAASSGPSAAGWVPVVALLVMLLVIAMIVVLGAG